MIRFLAKPAALVAVATAIVVGLGHGYTLPALAGTLALAWIIDR